MIIPFPASPSRYAYPNTAVIPPTPRPAEPTRLHLAVSDGNLIEVIDELAGGADPRAVTWFGYTPLHLCALEHGKAKRGWTDTRASALEAICAVLLSHGADPLARDFSGHMPSALAEGQAPRSLRESMEVAAIAGTWPEDERESNTKHDERVRAGRKPKADRYATSFWAVG